MSEPEDGGPAFPRPSGPEPRVDTYHECFDGMSLRDWFAGQAMIGLLQNAYVFDVPPERISELSYAHSDAMLAARKVKS